MLASSVHQPRPLLGRAGGVIRPQLLQLVPNLEARAWHPAGAAPGGSGWPLPLGRVVTGDGGFGVALSPCAGRAVQAGQGWCCTLPEWKPGGSGAAGTGEGRDGLGMVPNSPALLAGSQHLVVLPCLLCFSFPFHLLIGVLIILAI